MGHKRIKAAGTKWCHPLESTWFLVSSKTSEELVTSIQVELDDNDKLVVGDRVAEAKFE